MNDINYIRDKNRPKIFTRGIAQFLTEEDNSFSGEDIDNCLQPIWDKEYGHCHQENIEEYFCDNLNRILKFKDPVKMAKLLNRLEEMLIDLNQELNFMSEIKIPDLVEVKHRIGIGIIQLLAVEENETVEIKAKNIRDIFANALEEELYNWHQ